MPDDQSEKIIKLLEEIRDLTRERNGKFEEYVRDARERNDKYVEALQQAKEVQGRTLRQRRLFRWTAIPGFAAGSRVSSLSCLMGYPKVGRKGLQRTDGAGSDDSGAISVVSNEFAGNAALNRRA